MNSIVELMNIEKPAECCTLTVDTGNTYFYRGNKKIPGFTGLYFRDENHFFAIYPTKKGPVIYYQGNQFPINRSLSKRTL